MSPTVPQATLDAGELAELRSTVHDAVAEAGYPSRVRDLEGSTTGLDVDLWRLLSEEIGLAAVGLPESAGGLGGVAELLAVAEELGAGLAPVPFVSSTVLAGQALAGAEAGGHLERLAAGEIAAPVLLSGAGTWSAAAVGIVADGDRLTGSATFVPFGAVAAFLVVAARTPAGVDLYAVEAADATLEPQGALDFSRPSARVTLDSAPATRLTDGGGGAAVVDAAIDVALVATAADQLGGAQRCFDLTLEYVRIRRQFNREIGSFQAVKHRMADALMLVEMARSGLDRIVTEGITSADASVAKAWCSQAYVALAAEAIQLHGGVGFTWEHDAHLYFRRARYDAAFLGDATVHKERIAQLLEW